MLLNHRVPFVRQSKPILQTLRYIIEKIKHCLDTFRFKHLTFFYTLKLADSKISDNKQCCDVTSPQCL